MIRSVWVLLLCGMLLCGSLTFAATRRPEPTCVEPEYTLSLHVSDSDIWLGPPAQGFAQAAEVVVQVLDAQGQPVAGVPVEFRVEPSWTRSASLTPAQRAWGKRGLTPITPPITSAVLSGALATITSRLYNGHPTALRSIKRRESPARHRQKIWLGTTVVETNLNL